MCNALTTATATRATADMNTFTAVFVCLSSSILGTLSSRRLFSIYVKAPILVGWQLTGVPIAVEHHLTTVGQELCPPMSMATDPVVSQVHMREQVCGEGMIGQLVPVYRI